MKRALSACVAVLALVAAGCGSNSSSGPADPASLAPPQTLAYASFEIAPQGAERQDFDAAFEKLLGADPVTKLGQAFTKAAQTSGRLDYATDVEPWLGESVTAVVTSAAREHPDYALLVASTDDDKARAAIDKDLEGTGAVAREYRGVAYKAMNDGTVNGVVDHFLVAGSEPAFKAVVDTAKDHKSLADSDQWQQSVGSRADGKVGLGYLDLKAVLQSVAAQLPGAQQLAAPLLLGLAQLHPFVATLDANPDSLVVDVSSPGTEPDPRGPGAASSPLIKELPADAWAAVAVPKVGQALGAIATALKANPLIAAEYERVLAGVRQRTGIDLEKDVVATIGDVGLFARGSGARSAGAALVVESPKPAALARTLRRLPRLIRRSGNGDVRVVRRPTGFDVVAADKPRVIKVRSTRDGAIAATNAATLRTARHPSAKLGGTDLFRKAAAAVGARPTFFVDVAPVLQLVGSSSHHRGGKDFQRALPRLQHLEYLAAGASREGDLDVVRAVLGLR